MSLNLTADIHKLDYDHQGKSMRLNWHPPKQKQLVAVFTSEPNYSAIVHYGGIRTNGTRIPARPWITAAIGVVDFKSVFAESDGDIKKRFTTVAIALHQEIKNQIMSPTWTWNGITLRRSGEVAGSPRNIFDLGGLYEGQKCTLL